MAAGARTWRAAFSATAPRGGSVGCVKRTSTSATPARACRNSSASTCRTIFLACVCQATRVSSCTCPHRCINHVTSRWTQLRQAASLNFSFLVAGRLCEQDIDECINPPCVNGGTCTNLQPSYKCKCPAGFKGRNCEKDVDECALSVCRKGSTCINKPGTFLCVCAANFTG